MIICHKMERRNPQRAVSVNKKIGNDSIQIFRDLNGCRKQEKYL